MAFATEADLEALTGRSFETAQATLLLDLATAVIRSYTAQTLDQVEDDDVVLPGRWGSVLVLPERPVTAVAAISVDGTVLAAADWSWDGADKVYRGSRIDSVSINDGALSDGHWGGPHVQVEVTYTHGFPTIPDDIKAVCLAMADRAAASPGGVTQESVGSYSVTYARTNGVHLAADEQAILDRYRKTHHP